MNEQPHEFSFWDRYFRLNDDNKIKPYFNPITLRRAEAGFPHSNSATIRKNTFSGKWNAAKRNDVGSNEQWELHPKFASIFSDKVLKKGSTTSRVPVVDLALIMMRSREFSNAPTIAELLDSFRALFPMPDVDFDKIFVVTEESPDLLYFETTTQPDYDSAILEAIVEEQTDAESIPEASDKFTRIDISDPVLIQAQRLLDIGSSGIMLVGPPGTGKSFYARRIAQHLVSDPSTDVFHVQFHPSYGYEDFVEGYRPDEEASSGFRVTDKVFLDACARASDIKANNAVVVMVVDEINRGDPARVFGELLTYIERSYRDTPFRLPFSGKEISIPENLILLGTFNPHDRSVAQMDAAWVRRFDQIELLPSRDVVEELLTLSDAFSVDEVTEIANWFENIQALVPLGLGHSFFAGIRSIDHLRLVWQHRMRPTARQSIELGDFDSDADLDRSFEALIGRLEAVSDNDRAD